MIIIGSRAAKYWLGDKFKREPKDVDLVCVVPNSVQIPYHEFTVLPKDILSLIQFQVVHGWEEDFDVATLDALYTIKLSHLGWDIQWDKHWSDLWLFKANGAKLIPKLFDKLYKFWQKKHKNKPYLSLYKTKDKFFDDFVPHQYDHDYLHELVAHPYLPKYKLVLLEGQEVAIDKNKFDKLSLSSQVKMFREEVAVIALERWIIPSKGKIHWIKAWEWALKKTLVSLTKGWATKFILSNIEHFVKPSFEDFNFAFKVLKEEFTEMSQELTNEEQTLLLAPYVELAEKEKEKRYPWLVTPKAQLAASLLLEKNDLVVHRNDRGPENQGLVEITFRWADCPFADKKDKFVKATFWYYSHDGHDFDTVQFYWVSPRTELVTIYD